MPKPGCAEGPWPVPERDVGPVVEYSDQRQVVRVHHHVLDVDVEDGRSDSADTGWDIHALPHQMAGVEVGPDGAADGFTHHQQGRHVVDQVDRVQLKANASDAMGPAVLGQVTPEG